MKNSSMTALISAYSRAYHSSTREVKIFDDTVARKLFTDEEYHAISRKMIEGIKFFNPDFEGNDNEKLRFVVDHQLSPSPLGRSAYTETVLKSCVMTGTTQYIIFGAGYDTFAYRCHEKYPGLEIFEVDEKSTSDDKKRRLQNAGIQIPNNTHLITADFTKSDWISAICNNQYFDRTKITICSILGVSYYLTKHDFEQIFKELYKILPKGSSIVFDYPDENSYTQKAGERAKKQKQLATGANEEMLLCYSYEELEKMLSENGYLIYEHIIPKEITEQYFSIHNKMYPKNEIFAFDNVNYCLAVIGKIAKSFQ